MLLVAEQLGVFFGFGPTAPFVTGATLASPSLLALRRLGILTIDLGHDLADFGVGVRFDEVTEKIRQAQQVPESTDAVLLLFNYTSQRLPIEQVRAGKLPIPWTLPACHVSCQRCCAGAGWLPTASSVHLQWARQQRCWQSCSGWCLNRCSRASHRLPRSKSAGMATSGAQLSIAEVHGKVLWRIYIPSLPHGWYQVRRTSTRRCRRLRLESVRAPF